MTIDKWRTIRHHFNGDSRNSTVIVAAAEAAAFRVIIQVVFALP